MEVMEECQSFLLCEEYNQKKQAKEVDEGEPAPLRGLKLVDWWTGCLLERSILLLDEIVICGREELHSLKGVCVYIPNVYLR